MLFSNLSQVSHQMLQLQVISEKKKDANAVCCTATNVSLINLLNAYSSGMRSQALALLAFVRAGDTGPLVEKLVNHVASEGGDSAAVFWSSSSTKLVRVIAMAEYDTSRGSTNPDLALTVKSGQTTLLEVCPNLHALCKYLLTFRI